MRRIGTDIGGYLANSTVKARYLDIPLFYSTHLEHNNL